MSTMTNSKYFRKPEFTDAPDITVLNANWDLLNEVCTDLSAI